MDVGRDSAARIDSPGGVTGVYSNISYTPGKTRGWVGPLEDGTEVEDDDYLEHVVQHSLLLVRLHGQGFLLFPNL
jgi:hypothetical protein